MRSRRSQLSSRSTSIGWITACAFLAHTLMFAAGVAAQTSTGGLRGIIRDDTGGVLAGVTVEASSPARMGTATAITNSEGAYRLENLPVGQYVVTFTLSGFSTVRQEGIRVEVGRSIELDQMMKVSAVSETLTVTGQSPVVDTVHGGTSSNFNAELVSNIAVSRTSFFDVPALAPGVQVTNSSIGTGSGFNINGSDSNQNAFQYDGLDVSAPSFGGPFDWPNFDMGTARRLRPDEGDRPEGDDGVLDLVRSVRTRGPPRERGRSQDAAATLAVFDRRPSDLETAVQPVDRCGHETASGVGPDQRDERGNAGNVRQQQLRVHLRSGALGRRAETEHDERTIRILRNKRSAGII